MSEPDRQITKTRFLIVTEPRSGSYHLASLLDSAGDVTCLGELFKARRIELSDEWQARSGYATGDMARRDADPGAFLDRLVRVAGTPVFGFKEFSTRLVAAPLNALLLQDSGWKKLFLTRNPIRRYISMQRAAETGRFVSHEAATHRLDNAVIRFDPARFRRVFNADKALRKLALRLERAQPGQVMSVDYRDLGSPEHLARMLRFVGSDAVPEALSSRFHRQNDAGLAESLADFDLMRRFMQDEGHEALLQDALPEGR
ncbi:MAG: hypothetical protein Q4G36_00670 [Paracoccus sp. (in: a-proteobacteria)]|nr:hypothetical protein [Paracoccus sp. (in: a-proteobacteria)]